MTSQTMLVRKGIAECYVVGGDPDCAAPWIRPTSFFVLMCECVQLLLL